MQKIERLRRILAGLEEIVLAFSGGVDSSFLLKAAKDVLPGDRIIAVTAVSDTYTSSELRQAKRFAKELGIRHRIILTNEFKDPNFTKNPTDRCYYCKKELFKKLKAIAKKGGLKSVIDASNLDDEKDYRPGSKAKEEYGVRSPLQEAGITKNDIRRYSKKLGLKTWKLPSMACLASRIPYGQEIRKSTLRNIEKAEAFMKNLGISQARVRVHDDVARIEVDKKDIKRFFNQRFCDRIIKHFKKQGFTYITVDLEGYRTGSMNEVLRQE